TPAPGSTPAKPDSAPVADSPPTNPDSAPATADADTPPASGTAGRVNINTADLAALCALPGIGEALAGRVIEYREAHGPFASPDEIMNVSGIGAGKFSAIEALITTE
ncbi:MAG: helix-hairpin-helix domain-containing protein, partial [Oscillibacter sp.]|nr:helix-hairpin-helix domain-containing protein [Oscillibacter sp.]